MASDWVMGKGSPSVCFLLKTRYTQWAGRQICTFSNSNVKPTFFQDRKLSFCCFRSKKIEYIRFGNKILDLNDMFSISTQNFSSKSFRFVPFPNIF
jgi:hypothetical protein